MESLAGSDRDYAIRRVGLVSAFRAQNLDEDSVAERAGYRGVGHMRQELEGWDFPRWFIEGDAPPKPRNHSAQSKPAKPKRHARGSGPVIEIPPASNATPLFREKLEALARANEDLRHRKEKLQGGLFHQSAVYTDPVPIPREVFTEEQWELLVETHNLDPAATVFLDTDAKTWSLGGGTPAPQVPLPALIAAYILTAGDLRPLLATLYPGEPSAQIFEQIRECIEGKKNTNGATRDGLKVVAEQLARLVRGGPVRPGRNSAEVSRFEVNLACRITDDRKAGMPDQAIFDKLRSNPPFALEDELTWDEFRRLRDLNLKMPFQ
jgi:hypothetical protein